MFSLITHHFYDHESFISPRMAGDPGAIEITGLNLVISFLQCAPLIKNAAFKSESEWRLIRTFRDSSMQVDFREGHSYLIPFTRFRLTESQSDLLPVTYVRVGPGPHQELDALATLELLTARGLPSPVAPKSPIPYRAW